MKEPWSEGVSDFKGDFYAMDDCVLSPRPANGHIDIVAAGRSGTGMRFAAEHDDYNVVLGGGVNTPLAFADTTGALVGSYETVAGSSTRSRGCRAPRGSCWSSTTSSKASRTSARAYSR